MKQYLLGIDEGTTGCKTCIFDLEGNLIASDYREYPCYYPKPGWVEQLPEDITPALFASCKAAIEKAGVPKKDIIAIGISSQGAVWGPLDKDGQLLRPFISWQDLRGSSYVDKIKNGEIIDSKRYYEITGCPIGPIFGATKYLWFKDNEPELFEKTEYFSLHQDYFSKAFGAEGFWADTATASRTGLFDVDKLEWSQEVMDAFGLDASKFPKIAKGGQVVGKIPADIAEKTGLAEGTLICVGAMDQNCSTMGGGLVNGGDAVLVVGTFGSIYVGSDKPARDINGILTAKNNTGPENWTLEAWSAASACSYRWFRDTFCSAERNIGAEIESMDPYDLINIQIESVEPGAGGITFLPYLQGASGGARDNGYARGTLLGMTLGTTKAQIARAVMEGITMEMRDNVGAMRRANVEMNTIRLTGGATKSRLWNQMQADMYKVPVQVLQTSETGCLGAALYAGMGAGVYKDYNEAVDAAVQIAETYEPNPANYEAYDKAFERFTLAYNSLNNGGYFKATEE